MQVNSGKFDMETECAHLVFYDDRCPICSREINHYKKLVKYHPVTWIKISESEELLEEFGLKTEEALKDLHVLRDDGIMATRAEAFATIWSSLRYYRWLSSLVYQFKLIPLLNLVYPVFAKWRFQSLYCPGKLQ